VVEFANVFDIELAPAHSEFLTSSANNQEQERNSFSADTHSREDKKSKRILDLVMNVEE
jgi:hypothetical protein